MKKRFIRMAIALVMICALLVGCGSPNPSGKVDDAVIKDITVRALKEKYGEEFVVHKVYETTKDTYLTVCSPKNQRDVVFDVQVGIWQKDGEEKGSIGGIGTGAVAAKVSRQMEEELQEIFPDCYVHAVVFGAGGEDIDRMNCTLQEYMQSYRDIGLDPMKYMHILIQIHVGESTLGKDALEAEYRYFTERMQKAVAEDSFPPATIWIYYTDEETKGWCREYFHENYQGEQDYYDKLEGCRKICLNLYCGEEFSKTYEEYADLRKGER
ncbi:MAG: hypothetical protein NC251_05045 [Lachnoclostridium sp.]|nr:hypothetical protein [Lachnospira sp.]MCM1247779.1 hypothetical protein [Lachnoclostridium sp.]